LVRKKKGGGKRGRDRGASTSPKMTLSHHVKRKKTRTIAREDIFGNRKKRDVTKEKNLRAGGVRRGEECDQASKRGVVRKKKEGGR